MASLLAGAVILAGCATSKNNRVAKINPVEPLTNLATSKQPIAYEPRKITPQRVPVKKAPPRPQNHEVIKPLQARESSPAPRPTAEPEPRVAEEKAPPAPKPDPAPEKMTEAPPAPPRIPEPDIIIPEEADSVFSGGFRVKPPPLTDLLQLPAADGTGVHGNTVKIEEDDSQQTIRAEGRNIVVTGSNGEFMINGKCGKLIVSGSNNIFRCDEVQTIDVTGNGNRIDAESVRDGSVGGDSNMVTWRSASGGLAPTINFQGTNNLIERFE